jgi:serine/threonine protein kinase
MEPERWRRIEEVFLEAAELPAAEAFAFLDRACGDDVELRQEVQALLRSDLEAHQGLSAAVETAAARVQSAFNSTSSAYIGQHVGPYQVVREIGRGGMGAVYQAVRADDQYLRSVAIKFIAHGMDTPESLARFRTERQILANLQHPNIAALLDGGTTEDGRPYIVMEYIEGERLLDYCRQRNLSIPDRLELFRALCGGVHHAHQMLVIHRDIKPANVLVTADGIPKLLDFGIAKLLAPELVPGGGDEDTETCLRRLTPQYASPEQIRGETLTTASDVYSLGVLLYEMLTFESPYSITGWTTHEIERAVLNSEPRRLSVSAQNDVRLRRQLSGDLDNIVAMALRKEPHRRYASAQQLSDEITRYLRGLPVSAREDTLFYLASKLVRRNKAAAAAFALLAISVAGGWTATIRQARRSEARFQEVRKLANAVLFDFHTRIQGLPGSTPVREHLLRTALEYLNNLSRDAAGDLSLQWELSQAYEHVGDAQGDPSGPSLGQFGEALSSYQKALTLVERIAKRRRDWEVFSCMSWLHYKSGDLQLRTVGPHVAVESYSQGLKVAANATRALKDDRSDNLLLNGYQRMARVRLHLGENDAALENATLAAEAADRAAKQRRGPGAKANLARSRLLLGNILSVKGDLAGARKHYEHAVALLEQVVRAEPQSTDYLQSLEEAYRRSGELQGNHSYFHFGNPDLAESHLRKALEIAEDLVKRDPRDAQAQGELSKVLRQLGAVLRTREPNEAVQLYNRAKEILESLMREASGDLNYRRDLANTHLGLSYALHGMKKTKAAIQEIEAALAMQRELSGRIRAHRAVHEDMFDALLALSAFQLDSRDFTRARASLDEALSTAQFLHAQSKGSLYPERCLALASQKFGDYHALLASGGLMGDRAGHLASAEQWYERAVEIWSKWRRQDVAMPYSLDREREVAMALARLKRAVPVSAARR